jgi:hypothetical protein
LLIEKCCQCRGINTWHRDIGADPEYDERTQEKQQALPEFGKPAKARQSTWDSH